MARKKVRPEDLNGLSIYHDPKRGTVYYDPLTKNAYVITGSDVQSYATYTTVLPISILCAYIISYSFSLGYSRGIFIFLGLYVILKIIFRYMFLRKLVRIENWKPVKKDNIIVFFAKSYETSRLVLLALMLAALTILMPVNAVISSFSRENLYACFAISVLTGIGTILAVIAIIVKKRNDY